MGFGGSGLCGRVGGRLCNEHGTRVASVQDSNGKLNLNVVGIGGSCG